MTIAITGAAGQLGRLTARRVLERVPAGELVLVTRRPEAIADLAEDGAIVRNTSRARTARPRRLPC